MDLKARAVEYIQTRGAEKVAEQLKVKQSTVESWMKFRKFPMELLELVVAESEKDVKPEATPAAPDEPAQPETISPVMAQIVQVLSRVSDRIDALEARNFRPEPKPVQGPRVVAATPEDGEIAFQETARLGGDRPYSLPEPTVDTHATETHGMPMSELLKKRQSQEALLSNVLTELLRQRK